MNLGVRLAGLRGDEKNVQIRFFGGGGGGGGGGYERMKRICPCFTPSRIALAESARETLFRSLICFQLFFFCLEQATFQHSRYMI